MHTKGDILKNIVQTMTKQHHCPKWCHGKGLVDWLLFLQSIIEEVLYLRILNSTSNRVDKNLPNNSDLNFATYVVTENKLSKFSWNSENIFRSVIMLRTFYSQFH